MNDLSVEVSDIDFDVINSEMRSQFGELISGISYDISNSKAILRVHFFGNFDTTDEMAAQAILDVHDPVFISAERDGDTITVTVTKPRNVDAAAELTLTVDDTPLPEATALTDNAATVLIESADEITIGIVESYPHMEVTI